MDGLMAMVYDFRFDIFVTGGNLACFLIISTHSILTLCILRKRKELRQSSIFLYRVCQTSADLIVGVAMLGRFFFFLPRSHPVDDSENYTNSNCILLTTAYYICKTESMFCMVLVSLDRYMYIVYPIYYFRTINQRTVKLFLVVSWLMSTASVLVTFPLIMPRKRMEQCSDVYTDYKTYFIAFISILLASLSAIILLYMRLYACRARRLKTIVVSFKFQSVYFDIWSEHDPITDKKPSFFWSFIFVHVVYFAGWIAFIATVLAFYTIGISSFVVEVAVNISGLNSACNFYIMITTSPKFRHYFKENTLRIVRCRHKDTASSTDLSDSLMAKSMTSETYPEEYYVDPRDLVSLELREFFKSIEKEGKVSSDFTL